MIWLSHGRLPSYVETYCRIRNHTFIINDRIFVALCNPSNQEIENVTVAIRTDRKEASVFDSKAEKRQSEYSGIRVFGDSAYALFDMGRLASYDMALIEV